MTKKEQKTHIQQYSLQNCLIYPVCVSISEMRQGLQFDKIVSRREIREQFLPPVFSLRNIDSIIPRRFPLLSLKLRNFFVITLPDTLLGTKFQYSISYFSEQIGPHLLSLVFCLVFAIRMKGKAFSTFRCLKSQGSSRSCFWLGSGLFHQIN